MKNAILVLILIVFSPVVFATKASKYAEKQYCKSFKENYAKIIVKREHTERLDKHVEDFYIHAITYGYGDLKHKCTHKCCRKQRISYICILNCDYEPIWSWINFR